VRFNNKTKIEIFKISWQGMVRRYLYLEIEGKVPMPKTLKVRI